MQPNRRPTLAHYLGTALVLAVTAFPALGDGAGVTFLDIAHDESSGLTYQRRPSASEAIAQALREKDVFTLDDLIVSPDSSRGLPGVAIFDAEGDGDLDLYVTNGPEADNSLFVNQLRETGEVTFADRAASAGVGVWDQDSTGVCAGDLDNDGDKELLVLGNQEPNRLFENLGNAIFRDVTASSGMADDVYMSASCAFGDVDGDGLLDVVVSNAYDLVTRAAIIVVPFGMSQPNQLYRNRGGLAFEDVSAASGILDLDLPPEAPPRAATITWVMVLVDLDFDGDLDILQADDHGAMPFSANGGIDRGYVQYLENDGTGHFTSMTFERGLDTSNGDWMGFAMADFNGDDRLDFFSTNVSNQSAIALLGFGYPANEQRDSRAFLQRADGTFLDTSPDGNLNNPFGWGTSALDLENDGDVDVVYHGGFDFAILIGTAAGVVLVNDGSGDFRRDRAPMATSTDHLRRNVRGMAIGDLDGNGFDDIVSVSNFDYPEPIPLTPLPPLGGEFDVDSTIVETFTPLDPNLPRIVSPQTWNGYQFPDGTLSVELNQGETEHGWVQVELLGTVGLVAGSRSSRDAFGAVVRALPEGGTSAMRALLGGSSMASQDAELLTFGLGSSQSVQVDVFWPGGFRNRFFLEAGQRERLPEIPCSFDAPDRPFDEYVLCVTDSLDTLVRVGAIAPSERGRFTSQAIRAWHMEH